MDHNDEHLPPQYVEEHQNALLPPPYHSRENDYLIPNDGIIRFDDPFSASRARSGTLSKCLKWFAKEMTSSSNAPPHRRSESNADKNIVDSNMMGRFGYVLWCLLSRLMSFHCVRAWLADVLFQRLIFCYYFSSLVNMMNQYLYMYRKLSNMRIHLLC